MRKRREFTQQEIECFTTFWNAGAPAEDICRLAGISKRTFDYHRQCGAFTHLPKRVKGSKRKRTGRDCPENGMLFGMSRDEWEARKADVQRKWTLHEEFHRRTGIYIKETRAPEYNPGTDENRSHHPRHRQNTKQDKPCRT
jgi:hypothetical protein